MPRERLSDAEDGSFSSRARFEGIWQETLTLIDSLLSYSVSRRVYLKGLVGEDDLQAVPAFIVQPYFLGKLNTLISAQDLTSSFSNRRRHIREMFVIELATSDYLLSETLRCRSNLGNPATISVLNQTIRVCRGRPAFLSQYEAIFPRHRSRYIDIVPGGGLVAARYDVDFNDITLFMDYRLRHQFIVGPQMGEPEPNDYVSAINCLGVFTEKLRGLKPDDILQS